MDFLTVAYRDVDRTPLLYVLREMALNREQLDVHICHIPGSEEYEQAFLCGQVDVICEHIRFLFPARMAGHPVRCLASCQNRASDKLVVARGIHTAGDLLGQAVALRKTPSSQMSGAHWLKQLGLWGNVAVVIADDQDVGRWRQWTKVVAGAASAAICSPLYLDEALDAGLEVLDVPPLAEIGPLFFAALGPFITSNDDTVRRLMRALYRAMHVFHEEPDTAIAIMSNEPARLMNLADESRIREQYERLRAGYDQHPIPTPAALETTFSLVAEANADLKGLNPFTLWDLHYVLELEEAGFMDKLSAS